MNSDSFKATLRHFCDLPNIQYVHIDCHGANAGLEILDDVQEEAICEIINTARFRGIFFSACESEELAENVVVNDNINAGVWAAGYRENVEWIASTSFEILFWRPITSIAYNHLGPAHVLQALAKLSCRGYDNVMSKLGLHIWMKINNDIVNLVESFENDVRDNPN